MLYIDTETGTWGRSENLVILDDEASNRFLEISESLSDSQIAEWPSTQPRP